MISPHAWPFASFLRPPVEWAKETHHRFVVDDDSSER